MGVSCAERHGISGHHRTRDDERAGSILSPGRGTSTSTLRHFAAVHLLPDWAPKRYVVHAVYASKRGLLPSVRALLDYLGARFSELRED